MTKTKSITPQPATPNAHTQVALLIDRSGSMSGIAADMEGSIQTFIEEQKKSGDVSLSLFDFATDFKEHYLDLPPSEVEPYKLLASGGTALYDATIKTLDRLESAFWGHRKVLICIVTDGAENQSKTSSLLDVKNRIESAQKHGWGFVFLGANFDVASSAASMGVSRGATVQYTQSRLGQQNSFAMSSAVTSYMATGEVNLTALQEEEKKHTP